MISGIRVLWPRVFPLVYDAVMTWVERGPLGRWRHSTVHPIHGLVLEIGAGTGLDFSHYRADVTVIATDPDLAMLTRARSRATRARARVILVGADATALPFRAGAFDGGIVGLALCTIPEPANALAEMRRVLKGGAAVRLLEHVRLGNRYLARLQDLVTPLWMRLSRGCRLDRDAVAIVTEAGLTLESVTSHAGGYVVEIVAGRAADARGPEGRE
jgi:ubiquinone/menaquinone biosynthesis C-methylase UbiE